MSACPVFWTLKFVFAPLNKIGLFWVILPRARRPNRAPLNGRLVKDACSTFSYEEIVCRVDTINVRSFGPRSRVMPKGTVKDDLRGSEGRSSFEVDLD